MLIYTHIFSAKNIRILYIKSAKTVNEMTLNELVKLTMLWTTEFTVACGKGPDVTIFFFFFQEYISAEFNRIWTGTVAQW